MSLDCLLLGTLRTPASGYALKTQFDEAFRFFWPAELSQIYRTLKRLEDQGLLASRQAASDKGPERRVYRTTAKGRARLRQWLEAGPDIGDDRHAYCAQAFFLDALEDDEARVVFLRRLRDEFATRLSDLERIEAGWRQADPRYPDALPIDELSQQFVLALGIEKFAAIVRWADLCLKRLDARRREEGAS